jgi:GntR family transcriptional regulator
MASDSDTSLPLYLQVAAEIRREIAEGAIKPGGRLPPARDMAAVRGVNHNTMFRALRHLRDEGLLEFQRGRGITVVGDAACLSEVVARCRELLGFSSRNGYKKDEVLEIIASL